MANPFDILKRATGGITKSNLDDLKRQINEAIDDGEDLLAANGDGKTLFDVVSEGVQTEEVKNFVRFLEWKTEEARKVKSAQELFQEAVAYTTKSADPDKLEKKALLRDRLAELILPGDTSEILKDGRYQLDTNESLVCLLDHLIPRENRVANISTAKEVGGSAESVETQYKTSLELDFSKGSAASQMMAGYCEEENLVGANKYQTADGRSVDGKKQIRLEIQNPDADLVVSFKRFKTNQDAKGREVIRRQDTNERIALHEGFPILANEDGDPILDGEGQPQFLTDENGFPVRHVKESVKDATKSTLDKITVGNGNKEYLPTSFIVHRGTIKGGHYVAYVKELVDGREVWACYNDSIRTEIKDAQLEGNLPPEAKQAYVVKYSPVNEHGKCKLPPSQGVGTPNGGRVRGGGNQCWANAAFAFVLSMSSLHKESHEPVVSARETLQQQVDGKTKELESNYSNDPAASQTALWLSLVLEDLKEKTELETILSKLKDLDSAVREEVDKNLEEMKFPLISDMLRNASSRYLLNLAAKAGDNKRESIIDLNNFFSDEEDVETALKVVQKIQKNEAGFLADPHLFVAQNIPDKAGASVSVSTKQTSLQQQATKPKKRTLEDLCYEAVSQNNVEGLIKLLPSAIKQNEKFLIDLTCFAVMGSKAGKEEILQTLIHDFAADLEKPSELYGKSINQLAESLGKSLPKAKAPNTPPPANPGKPAAGVGAAPSNRLDDANLVLTPEEEGKLDSKNPLLKDPVKKFLEFVNNDKKERKPKEVVQDFIAFTNLIKERNNSPFSQEEGSLVEGILASKNTPKGDELYPRYAQRYLNKLADECSKKRTEILGLRADFSKVENVEVISNIIDKIESSQAEKQKFFNDPQVFVQRQIEAVFATQSAAVIPTARVSASAQRPFAASAQQPAGAGAAAAATGARGPERRIGTTKSNTQRTPLGQFGGMVPIPENGGYDSPRVVAGSPGFDYSRTFQGISSAGGEVPGSNPARSAPKARSWLGGVDNSVRGVVYAEDGYDSDSSVNAVGPRATTQEEGRHLRNVPRRAAGNGGVADPYPQRGAASDSEDEYPWSQPAVYPGGRVFPAAQTRSQETAPFTPPAAMERRSTSATAAPAGYYSANMPTHVVPVQVSGRGAGASASTPGSSSEFFLPRASRRDVYSREGMSASPAQLEPAVMVSQAAQPRSPETPFTPAAMAAGGHEGFAGSAMRRRDDLGSDSEQESPARGARSAAPRGARSRVSQTHSRQQGREWRNTTSGESSPELPSMSRVWSGRADETVSMAGVAPTAAAAYRPRAVPVSRLQGTPFTPEASMERSAMTDDESGQEDYAHQHRYSDSGFESPARGAHAVPPSRPPQPPAQLAESQIFIEKNGNKKDLVLNMKEGPVKIKIDQNPLLEVENTGEIKLAEHREGGIKTGKTEFEVRMMNYYHDHSGKAKVDKAAVEVLNIYRAVPDPSCRPVGSAKVIGIATVRNR